jgi:hypothetical protein
MSTFPCTIDWPARLIIKHLAEVNSSFVIHMNGCNNTPYVSYFLQVAFGDELL